MDKEIKVLHCGGGWPTNIGNAFIDFGIRYLIKKTIPNSKVYFASNAMNWIYYKYGNPKRNVNFLDVAGVIKADFYVFGGSMLSPSWFKDHLKLFQELAKKDSKIIMYGVGGETYSDNEINETRKYLKKLNMFALISRDEKAFKNYCDLVEHSYNGIDCAFFLNDAFIPAKLDLSEYVVFSFDNMAEPNIELEVKEKIIRTHHAPWRFLSNQIFSKTDLKIFLGSIKHHQRNIIKKNDMLSDLPDDYLNLYANCKATYSDRVHACVAALSFGNSARLYSKSARSFLLDRIGLSSIRDNLVSLDRKQIEKEKKKQIDFLNEILKS